MQLRRAAFVLLIPEGARAEPETGELQATLTDQKDKLERVEFSPDGNTLVAATNKTVKLWNSNNGQLLAVLDKARAPVQFSPNGETLATGGEENVTMLWDCQFAR